MAQMSEKDREAVKKEFGDLKKPVKIINFTQQTECMYCRETRELLEETASLSDIWGDGCLRMPICLVS